VTFLSVLVLRVLLRFRVSLTWTPSSTTSPNIVGVRDGREIGPRFGHRVSCPKPTRRSEAVEIRSRRAIAERESDAKQWIVSWCVAPPES